MKLFILSIFFSYSLLQASAVQLIKKENPDSNTTLLVIGGIHGNEPGGYFAAAILATHYTIKSKNLWIVPNLNKESIMANRRGIHGDMNRKFAFIRSKDKDKPIVESIKKIILDPKVTLILNLHDGHGFYRQKEQNSIFNPNAWGQTCVIDQCNLNKKQLFGNLNEIAENVQKSINKKLLKKHHIFNVKNTQTKFKDEQMRLSLTYFAVKNNKPAFAIETSKSLSSTSQKVFYQLLAIEGFMKIMDINYSKDFVLNEKNIAKIIKNYGTLEINHNILLNLSDIKNSLSFIPIKSRSNEFVFSHPLGMSKKNRHGRYDIFIGNKKIVSLKPQYFKMEQNCPETYEVEVDKKQILVKKASYFSVKDDFKIIKNKKYRVNIIGYHAKNRKDESNILISKQKLNRRYAVDKAGKTFRIEFYKDDKFCSMIMVKFK